jgi:hypothetical protein
MPYNCIDCKYFDSHYYIKCGTCKDNSHFEQKEEINTCSTCKFHKDDNSNFGSSPCTSCFNFNKWVNKEYKPVHEIKCCLCKFYDYQYDETLGEQFERCKNPMNCKNFKSRILTNDKENNNMSAYKEEFKELVDKFNSLNKELNELSIKIKDYEQRLLDEDKEEDVLAKYKRDLANVAKGYNFFLDNDSEVDSGDYGFAENTYNPYNLYVTEKIANQSAKMKKFNDLLLAYKYCYEEDYEPDWTNDSTKYIISYDTNLEMYYVDDWSWSAYNTVMFGNKSVANNCAKWLNEIDPKGELIK